MNISREMVRSVFMRVLQHDMSLTEADNWARAVVRTREAGDLVFVPMTDEAAIWKGVMYLFGVDLEERPGVPLHSVEQIREALAQSVGE